MIGHLAGYGSFGNPALGAFYGGVKYADPAKCERYQQQLEKWKNKRTGGLFRPSEKHKAAQIAKYTGLVRGSCAKVQQDEVLQQLLSEASGPGPALPDVTSSGSGLQLWIPAIGVVLVGIVAAAFLILRQRPMAATAAK